MEIDGNTKQSQSMLTPRHQLDVGCKECGILWRTDAIWMFRIGTVFEQHALHSREELDDVSSHNKLTSDNNTVHHILL